MVVSEVLFWSLRGGGLGLGLEGPEWRYDDGEVRASLWI